MNTHALFAEHFPRPRGSAGRAGVIVTTGIATDVTTAPFFAHLVAGRHPAGPADFENRAGLFPDAHRRFKFRPLTIGRDESRPVSPSSLPERLNSTNPDAFTPSPEDTATLNPNTRTAPVFRSRADAELIAKIQAKAPVPVGEGEAAAGNPRRVLFTGMSGLGPKGERDHLPRHFQPHARADAPRYATPGQPRSGEAC